MQDDVENVENQQQFGDAMHAIKQMNLLESLKI